MEERSHLAIGEVLSLLHDEFPDVTISKIRFLESQGLVDPERTPSGYRKFYDADVERLRWILLQQKEHFLPLKVIKDRLAELDAGGLPLDDALLGSTLGAEGASPEEDTDIRPGVSLSVVPSWSAGGDGPELTDAGRAAPTLVAVPDVRAAANLRGDEEAHPGQAHDPGVHATEVAGLGAQLPPTLPLPAAEASHEQDAGAGSAGEESAGEDPAGVEALETEAAVTVPVVAHPEASVPVSGDPDTMTLEELAAATGLELAAITELQQFGLVTPSGTVGGTTYFDQIALEVARTAAGFASHGVEARHLRAWRNSAEREVSIFEQVVMPLLRQRNPQARGQAEATLAELAGLGADLRAALIRQALRSVR